MGQSSTDEQQASRAAIRDFAARKCGTPEQRAQLTDSGEQNHNQGIYERIADLGWIGVALPSEYGSGGLGPVDQCLMLEESAAGALPITGIRTSLIVAGNYERAASDDQKRHMLGEIIRGRVQAIAMSEPEAGSDVANIRCAAATTTDGFVINGHKTWCSNAHLADHLLLACRTGGSRHEGVTLLEVPTSAPGIEMERIQTMNGRDTNDVFFTDCVVPQEAVVGSAGAASPMLMGGLNIERLILAATMLGLAQRALDDCLAYIKQRKQFGRTIGSFQTIKHRFAELATEVECCRLLVYAVTRQVDAQPTKASPREASMAKLKVTETARHVTLECVQMMGGYGCARESEVERSARQAIGATIYGGTNEIQREIIAKAYGL